jgi:hypothetical protein
MWKPRGGVPLNDVLRGPIAVVGVLVLLCVREVVGEG